jgi:hypothetical protein
MQGKMATSPDWTSFGTAGTPAALRSLPVATGDPRRVLSFMSGQCSSGECRLNGSANSAARAASSRRGPTIHSGVPFGSDGASESRGRIDKSQLYLGEPRRLRDKEHLLYVASQPCVVCSRVPGDAHHIRFAQPKALGAKVSDEFTVPLCRDHHRELHNSGNERSWWHDMGIDPLPVARRLWEESHARDEADQDGGKGAGSTQQAMAALAPAVPMPEGIGSDQGRDD